MLARLFGHINSSTNFFLLIWVVTVASVDFYGFRNNQLILELLWGEVHFLPWASFLITVGALLVITFSFQWLIHAKHHLLKRHAFLPYFMVLTLVLAASENLNLFILFFLLILVLGGWLSVFQGENVFSRVLNTGLLLGAGTLVDQRMAILVPFTYVVYIMFGRFNLRTSLILLVGFFSIWINAFGLEFVIFDTTSIWQYFIGIFSFKRSLGFVSFSPVFLGTLGLMAVLGLLELPNTLRHASVFKRQSYVLLSILLAISAVSFLLYPGVGFFVISGFFSSLILFVNFFQYAKKLWLREAIMWLAIGIFVVSHLHLI